MLASRAALHAAHSPGHASAELKKLVLNGTSRLQKLTPFHHGEAHLTFPTPEEFSDGFLQAKRPGHFVKLAGSASSPYRWPACHEWPGQAIGNGSGQGPLGGLATIPELQGQSVNVEVAAWGRGYGDGVRQGLRRQGREKVQEGSSDDADAVQAWTQLRLALPMFFDAFINGAVPQQSKHELVGYLAQQDLFDTSATLRRQCPPLPHALAGARGSREQWRRNLWIGGAGTFTPIHCDPYENLFVQVVGTKRFHIFPPDARKYLYLFDAASSMQPNTSSIATEAPLLVSERSTLGRHESTSFPLLDEAIETSKDARHVVMNAGDCLYIPQGWFHCVSSLSVSASVNAWFR